MFAITTITTTTSKTLTVADTATFLTYMALHVDGASVEFSVSCISAPSSAVTKETS